jgi:thiamine biosynthesis lipoprotein
VSQRIQTACTLSLIFLQFLQPLQFLDDRQVPDDPRAPSAQARVELDDQIMGTTFSVVVYGADRARLAAAARATLEEARRIDRLLSNYDANSEWSRVNRLAAAGPVPVSAELFDVLSACLEYSRLSEGAFDVTVGPLMKLWGFYKGEGTLPAAAAVADVLPRIGYQHVRLDRARRTVAFDRQGVELDPGGIGKGYAVDRMAAHLKAAGMTAALISASGSSIYALGAPPDEPRGWRVPIRSPGNASQTAAEVFLVDTSISTSGSYEKFFRADGRLYAHIMDPRTGQPARGASSVSVIAPRTLDSEAWAKPYFVNGRAWTAAHIPAGFRVFFCDDASVPQCGWIVP